MNFKIKLYIFKDGCRIKKLGLEEGEYTLGKEDSCDIIIKEE